ncbi:Fumarate reductase flavoprotein subunit [Fusarium oxysporum f. sp. albedinis]|nr:Fumarate reductase flavoprotein subunit [Fusarium oxysporum f. sp. albedinis]
MDTSRFNERMSPPGLCHTILWKSWPRLGRTGYKIWLTETDSRFFRLTYTDSIGDGRLSNSGISSKHVISLAYIFLSRT